jgi:hypothetical protein
MGRASGGTQVESSAAGAQLRRRDADAKSRVAPNSPLRMPRLERIGTRKRRRRRRTNSVGEAGEACHPARSVGAREVFRPPRSGRVARQGNDPIVTLVATFGIALRRALYSAVPASRLRRQRG